MKTLPLLILLLASSMAFCQTICNTPATIKLQNFSTVYKTNFTPITLQATPTGGIFYGTGVVGNKLYPSTLIEGSYSIVYVYVDSLGCSSTRCQDFEIQKPTGIDTVVQNANFSLYPNPSSSGIYTISFNLLCSSDVRYTVYSTFGSIILDKTVKYTTIGMTTENIDISSQSNGMYFIQVMVGKDVRNYKVVYMK